MWLNNSNNNEADWAIFDPAGDIDIPAHDDYNDALGAVERQLTTATSNSDYLKALGTIEEICEHFTDVSQYDDAVMTANIINPDNVKNLTDTQQVDYQQATKVLHSSTLVWAGNQFDKLTEEDVQNVIDALYA